jgi:hypothetical protein
MDITSDDVQNWLLGKATTTELKMLQEIIKLKLRTQLKVGDPVWFDARTRGIIHGKISKINAKTVKVLTDNGMQWTVDANLLQPEPTQTGNQS